MEFDNEKAEVLARAFANVRSLTNYSAEFQRHKYDIEQNHACMFANDAPVTEMTEHLNKEIAQLELNLAIQQLKNSAPGEDQITYEFFQQIPATGRLAILRLFNAVWRSGRLCEVLETCNRHTDIEVWKGPASYIVIPTDIADVNTQQADGETDEKPANVVSGEVQPAVEHTVRFSKRQKHH